MTYSVLLAIGLALTMIATSVFIVFYHDTKHEEIEQRVDFSFSGETFRRALGYYRFMAVSMLVFYVLFTCSCLVLQADGYLLFSATLDGRNPVRAGPIATSLFALDLVLRGGFFDIMEHFDLGISPVYLNRGSFWFVWYSFVFRIFFGLTLLKILFSFVWIYGKARMATEQERHARRAAGDEARDRPS
jgi:hypothetical protein